MAKKRLDQLLVEKGYAPSRERAQGLILAGKVLVDDSSKVKPGQQVSLDSVIRVKGDEHPYVSRGGLKLEAAIREFKVSASGKTALDIGASTGGFCHVLILNGIEKVFAVDVGHNQMDWKIRSDPKIVLLEGVNARYLQFEQIKQKVDLIVVDVSFISLEKILPALIPFAMLETDWITLIKPQFEVGREKVGKGGIVGSEVDRLESVDRVTQFSKSLGLIRHGLIESPISGTEGNKEYLAHWKLK